MTPPANLHRLGAESHGQVARNKGDTDMAKGMNKRKDVKKPKKEVVKPGAAAPSTKNSVQTSSLKAKE
jgi:hypothetical protein